MRRVPWLFLGLVLGAASCTALPPPREWGRTPRRSTPPPGAARPSPAPTLASLSFEEAVRLGRERNPSVAAARSRIERAETVLRESRALALPGLDARASWVRFFDAATFRGRTGSDVSGASTRTRFFTGRGSDIYSAGVDLRYPLFDGGEAWYAREGAGSALKAAAFEAESIQEELGLRIAEAYIEVLLARGAIRIAEESLRFAEGEEARARVRAETGEGLKVDELRFATRASENRLILNLARADQETRILALSELLGTPLSPQTGFLDPRSEPPLPAGDLVEAALARRPEAAALRERLAEGRSRIERERSRRRPRVEIFGSYGFISLDELEVDQSKDELQGGVALSHNLFEGGAAAARVAGLEAALAELEAEERGLLLGIERQVKEARIQVQISQENVEVAQKTAELAEEVLQRMAARYRSGEAQSLDVTEAEVQRTRAQLEHLRSRLGLLLTKSRLLWAVGT